MNKFMKGCLWTCLGCTIVAIVLVIAGVSMGGAAAAGESFSKMKGNETLDWLWNHANITYFDDDIFDDDFLADTSNWESDGNAHVMFFPVNEIQSLDFSVKYGNLLIKDNPDKNENQIEVRVDDSSILSKISCKQDGNKLVLEDKRTGKMKSNKDIIVYIPSGINFQKIVLDVGAGGLYMEEALLAEDMEITVGAGTLTGNCIVKELSVECGVGDADITANILRSADIECGMGDLSLSLMDDYTDYAYDISCGLGNVDIGEQNYSGITDVELNESVDREISIDCGLGNVKIDFDKSL